MLVLAVPSAALALALPTRLVKGDKFTILDNLGSDCLEVVASSRVRHDSHVPSFDLLERRLAAARSKHRALTLQCAELDDQPSRLAWCAAELATLKKRKLREKDKIASVLALMRHHPQQTSACQLGSGHYSEVLLGRSERHGRVAIKVAPLADDATPRDHDHLAREAAVLRALADHAGFPRLLHYGAQPVRGRQSAVLVMELLGPSLDELCWQVAGGTTFSAATVRRIGGGVLRRLHALHGAGYAHNDVKPANVLLGAPGGGRERVLHLVDFGIASPLGDATCSASGGASGGASSAAGGDGTPLGTPLFASAAAHVGARTSAADDVESLCYTLAFLAAGRLPWQQRTPPARVAEAKRRLLAGGWAEDAPGAGAPPEASAALHDLWAQVVRARAAPSGEVDYDACAAALGVSLHDDDDAGGGPVEPFDWERGDDD